MKNSMYHLKNEKERRQRRKTNGQRVQERRIRSKEYSMRIEPNDSKKKRELERIRDFEEEYYDDY